jgi:fatty acid desaturase
VTTAEPSFVQEPDWYKVPVDRKTMKGLQRRTNLHGLLWVGSYVAGLVLFGRLLIASLGTVWNLVFFLAFSTVYAFSEAILHETHHRTPFRSLWLNEVVHYVAGLFAFKEPIRDRWLHAAHHTYTYYPEIDPEVASERPPNFLSLVLDLFRLRFVVVQLGSTIRNAFAPLDPLARRFVPQSEERMVIWSARGCVAYYLAVIGLAAVLHSWYPILFVFAARFPGALYHCGVGLVQHVGLAENVADWRLNTRTVLMSPLTRLLYWNMNFHVEHHSYPTVPFHSLPALSDAMAAQMPPPYPSTWAAWREMAPTLWKERRNPDFFVQRPIPEATDMPRPRVTEAQR